MASDPTGPARDAPIADHRRETSTFPTATEMMRMLLCLRTRSLFKAVGPGAPWSLPEQNDEVAFKVRQLEQPRSQGMKRWAWAFFTP